MQHQNTGQLFFIYVNVILNYELKAWLFKLI